MNTATYSQSHVGFVWMTQYILWLQRMVVIQLNYLPSIKNTKYSMSIYNEPWSRFRFFPSLQLIYDCINVVSCQILLITQIKDTIETRDLGPLVSSDYTDENTIPFTSH